MGHDTRGHAGSAQGHRGNTHPWCDRFSFTDGAGAVVLHRNIGGRRALLLTLGTGQQQVLFRESNMPGSLSKGPL